MNDYSDMSNRNDATTLSVLYLSSWLAEGSVITQQQCLTAEEEEEKEHSALSSAVAISLMLSQDCNRCASHCMCALQLGTSLKICCDPTSEQDCQTCIRAGIEGVTSQGHKSWSLYIIIVL